MESGTGRVNIVLSWNWFTHIIMVIFILYEITHWCLCVTHAHAMSSKLYVSLMKWHPQMDTSFKHNILLCTKHNMNKPHTLHLHSNGSIAGAVSSSV